MPMRTARAHRKRKDNRCAIVQPKCSAGQWRDGCVRWGGGLHKIFCTTRYLRRLDQLGYVHFRRWKLYGSETLARKQAVVWVHRDVLTVEYDETSLTQHTVHYLPDDMHLKNVTFFSRRFETLYCSAETAEEISHYSAAVVH